MAMSEKKKIKTLTILSSIITFACFGYKLALGIMTTSLALMIVSLSTLLLFACKVTFIRNVTASRADKKKAYLFMAIFALVISICFIVVIGLRLFGIDTSNKKTYEGLIGAIYIGAFVIIVILSSLNLRKALQRDDLMVKGLREATFLSALADLVFIEEFVARIILRYVDFPYMETVNSYFCLAIGVAMLIVAICMFVRHHKYEVKV